MNNPVYSFNITNKKKLLEMCVKRSSSNYIQESNEIGSYEFYVIGSVQRYSILIRSNELQHYAGVYFLQNHSKCFGCLSQPSSGVYQTVTAVSGTGYSLRAMTFHQSGLMRTLIRPY